MNKISLGRDGRKRVREEESQRERSWLEGVIFAGELLGYTHKFKVQKGIVKTAPSDTGKGK